MTDFLVIAGIPVPVMEGTFKANHAADYGGVDRRAYAGNLRSTRRWEKASWSFSAGDMIKSDGEALKAAVALNVSVSVTGEAITATCRVTIGEETVVTASTADDNDWIMQYAVTMRQV